MLNQHHSRKKIKKSLVRFVASLQAEARQLWSRDLGRLMAAGTELSIYLDFQADEHARRNPGRYAGTYELLVLFMGSGGVCNEPGLPKSDLLDLTYRELLVAFVVNELDRARRFLAPRSSRNVAYDSHQAPEAESIFSALIALREAQGLAASRRAH